MQKVFLCVHHHSDLVWRRTKEDYNRIRERQILHVLKLLDKYPELCFCYAQAEVIKTFFNQHPELKQKIKRLIEKERIGLVGGLLSIPDTNLVSGEALIRNLLLGISYYEKEFGREIKVGWFMDCFGMNAQLPQVLKGLGFAYLFPGRLPGLPDSKFDKGFLWKGLDGSSIVTANYLAGVETVEYLCNLPIIYSEDERIDFSLRRIRNLPENIFTIYSTEENLINESVLKRIRTINKTSGKKIIFAHPEEYFQALREENLPKFTGEFNPTFTGCYTSRIELKRLNHQAESSLVTAEKLLALTNLISGLPYPSQGLDTLWGDLSICQFHDGICGCHNDEVFDYLRKSFNEIIRMAENQTYKCLLSFSSNIGGKEKILVFNPVNCSVEGPVRFKASTDFIIKDADGNILPIQQDGKDICFVTRAPSFGYNTLNYIRGKSTKDKTINQPGILKNYKFETEFYQVMVNRDNIKIKAKFLSKDVFPDERFGEIIFREDIGDLWTEDYTGTIFGKETESEEIKAIIKGEVFTKIVFEGRVKPLKIGFDYGNLWEGFGFLTWKKEFIFYNKLKRFDLKIILDWTGKNTKILVSFPLLIEAKEARSYYEIPFGFLERKPYFEVPVKFQNTLKEFSPSILETAKGDWPALNWVNYSDKKVGVALANKGTPGHQLVGGKILVSLLRSPTKKSAGFLPGLTALENGRHIYEFAFLPHRAGSLKEAVSLGTEFNNPPLAIQSGGGNSTLPNRQSFLSVSEPGIVISAFKKAHRKEGLIIRFYETLGRKCKAKLEFGFPIKEIWEVGLNEILEKRIQGNYLNFKPFEIKTLLLR